jgi:hypothetical protein
MMKNQQFNKLIKTNMEKKIYVKAMKEDDDRPALYIEAKDTEKFLAYKEKEEREFSDDFTDTQKEVMESDADVVIMCECAFGNNYDDLIEMSRVIKGICKTGKKVTIIPDDEEF